MQDTLGVSVDDIAEDQELRDGSYYHPDCSDDSDDQTEGWADLAEYYSNH